ncbi:MAG: transketolase [Clostridia bacterium]|nr:transketolase [Clostridia bacterium]
MEDFQKALNELRVLAAETVSNAKSGHTGTAIGAASIMLALFHDHLKFNPYDSDFINRDRVIFSAGHASALYYSLLHLFDYPISIDDLKQFRKYGSKTPGHPEFKHVPGVETTTGPLGQGIANGVGMAIAESVLEKKFNTENFKIIDNYTYVLTGDGCLMEGVGVEAASLAGTLKLNKLILLYDDNEITIDGNRSLANTENTAQKFKAMGWNVIEVSNGNDYVACSKAISKAKTETEKPTIIIFKTIIGIGTKKEGTSSAHAMPLSPEDLAEFKEKMGVNGSFCVSTETKRFCMQSVSQNGLFVENWKKNLGLYMIHEPEKYGEFKEFFAKPKIDYKQVYKKLTETPELAGRDLSSIALNEFSKFVPTFLGGTADLGPSTKAVIKDGETYSAENRLGKNIHFGIREHAMGSIANGIALYSNFNVFDSTFLSFSNYMLPALRMRALMKIPVLSIFTHDCINVGEDGPTHQPIEQLAQLRLIPHLQVARPATHAELVSAFKLFIEKRVPLALIMSKSTIKNLSGSTIEKADKGGYVIYEPKTKIRAIIFASGTEVELAEEVAKSLKDVGVRVVSVPNEKVFEAQSEEYKNSVLLTGCDVLRVSIEASNDLVWLKYIGSDGIMINVDDYQTSAPGKEVYEKAGFNKDHIAKEIMKNLK